jgi:G3E family GTPase
VNKLLKRRNKFDAIIIETTGLANPAPVIQVWPAQIASMNRAEDARHSSSLATCTQALLYWQAHTNIACCSSCLWVEQ